MVKSSKLTNTAIKAQCNVALRLSDLAAKMLEKHSDMVETLKGEAFDLVKASMDDGVLEIPKAAERSFNDAKTVEDAYNAVFEVDKAVKKMMLCMRRRYPELKESPKAKTTSTEEAVNSSEATPASDENKVAENAVTIEVTAEVETAPLEPTVEADKTEETSSEAVTTEAEAGPAATEAEDEANVTAAGADTGGTTEPVEEDAVNQAEDQSTTEENDLSGLDTDGNMDIDVNEANSGVQVDHGAAAENTIDDILDGIEVSESGEIMTLEDLEETAQ